MAKYIAKRVALALVTLVIVSMLTFFLMFLVPGGPFLSEKSPSPAVLAAMEEKYGLDKPVIVQYKNYMLNLLQLSLIHISEPTRLGMISYAVFCLKKKKNWESPMKMINTVREKIKRKIR